MKAISYFDIFAQIEAITRGLLTDCKFGLDFNGFLLEGAYLLHQQTRKSLIEPFA